MLDRPGYLEQLRNTVSRSPVTALLGPRQCGKTTLARLFATDRQATFFDLESVVDRRRLQNPELVLGGLPGLVILDEIQEAPELYAVLRVLVDRPGADTRFLILGSASPQLTRGASESLAGRIEFIEMGGFDLTDTGAGGLEALWLRGGFPRSWLAASESDSLAWREGFVRTFLERDIPQLGIRIPAPAMRRFWTMLAHHHGQTWNASELARSMGLSDKTVRGYLDLLTGTYMLRQLQPWHENLGKRQVKAPRIYFRDPGLLHHLLDIPTRHHLLGHPKVWASWEGFAIEQILRAFRAREAYFWATHEGAEVDLLFTAGGRKLGFEIRFTEAPRMTASMRTAQETLGLDHLYVVHPGAHRFPMGAGATALPLAAIPELATDRP